MVSSLAHPVHFEGDACLVADLDFIAWSRYSEAIPSGLMSHSHGDAYELCFVKRGTSDWWVGEDTYRIHPGDLFLTKPSEVHGGQDDTMQPCELFWIQFRLNPLTSSFALSTELTASLDKTLRNSSCRKVKAPEFIESHFLRMFVALNRNDQYSAAVVNSSMQLLLVEVVNKLRHSMVSVNKQDAYSERVKETVEWIRSDVGSVLSVSEMAQRAGLKPSQFRDVFRAETGYSPIEFLNGQRVRRAKELLRTTDQSVTDIALEVGFKSAQYFATCFRKITGITPQRYRISCRKQQ